MTEPQGEAAARRYAAMPTEALLQTFLAEIPGRDWLHLPDELRRLIWEMQKRFREQEGPPQPVLGLLAHEDWAVRQNSAVILGDLGGPEVVRALEKAALTDEDRRVKVQAARNLHRIHSAALKWQAYEEVPLASLVAALVAEIIDDWNDSLADQRPIMRALVKRLREEERAPDILLPLLSDDARVVRRISALMLGFIRRPEAINPLARAMFTDDDAGVRAQAASSLERIGTPGALAALKAWLREFEFTIEKRLTTKLWEHAIYGETDAGIVQRLATLADKKGVSPDIIRNSYLSRNDAEDLVALLLSQGHIVLLSHSEQAYLEGAIATYDDSHGRCA